MEQSEILFLQQYWIIQYGSFHASSGYEGQLGPELLV